MSSSVPVRVTFLKEVSETVSKSDDGEIQTEEGAFCLMALFGKKGYTPPHQNRVGFLLWPAF